MFRETRTLSLSGSWWEPWPVWSVEVSSLKIIARFMLARAEVAPLRSAFSM